MLEKVQADQFLENSCYTLLFKYSFRKCTNTHSRWLYRNTWETYHNYSAECICCQSINCSRQCISWLPTRLMYKSCST